MRGMFTTFQAPPASHTSQSAPRGRCFLVPAFRRASITGRSDYDQLKLCDDASQAAALYYPGRGAVEPCNWFEV